MRHRVLLCALALIVVASLSPIGAKPAEGNADWSSSSPADVPRPETRSASYDPRTVLVRFKKDSSSTARSAAIRQVGAVRSSRIAGSDFVKVPVRYAASAVRTLRENPAVGAATFNFRRELFAEPNDEKYTEQHYLDTVRMPEAWDQINDASGQVIAVVDTGVDASHPDLVDRVVAGHNVLDPTAPPDDYDPNTASAGGHGTAVAGLAAANTNNTYGMAGVTWSGRVMPIKAVHADGTALDSDLIAGIVWAADHGAAVINLSLGSPPDSPALHDAVKYATDHGALVVGAAGNSGHEKAQYPAAYAEVLAVGATESHGGLTDFSDFGEWIDVVAPGFEIVSTSPVVAGYSFKTRSGTSLAAAIASGVAALVRARYPSLSSTEVLAHLGATARDAGPRGIDPYYGHGLLDAAAAVGGSRGAELPWHPNGLNEPNDVPARATPFSTGIDGAIEVAGDVDWFRFRLDEPMVEITVTPAQIWGDDPDDFDPVLALYDSKLRLIREVDAGHFEFGPEQVRVEVKPNETYYVKVHSDNGVFDTSYYNVEIRPVTHDMFEPPQAITVGGGPSTVAIGDVTGDSRDDVVLATGGFNDPENDNKLFVFAQRADGTLATPTRYAPSTGSATDGVALLDIDGDHKLDVAVGGSGGIALFRQVNGALQDAGSVSGGSYAGVVSGTDMDGDGDEDLVAHTTEGLIQLIQDEPGEFREKVITTEATRAVDVADVNADGRPDIVFELASGLSAVRVLKQVNDGWHQTQHQMIHHVGGIYDVDVADVSGDDRADIVASIGGNVPNAFAGVLIQTSAGGFAPAAEYETDDSPEPVEAGDVSGDGQSDIVIAGGPFLTVHASKSDGTFRDFVQSDPFSSASFYSDDGLALGDINADGKKDAVLANPNGRIVVFRNKTGRFPPGEQQWIWSVSPTDFNPAVTPSAAPAVSFQRALVPSSVNADTVRLRNGRTGDDVQIAVTYDSASKKATLTPAAVLETNTPYSVVIGAVRDLEGNTHGRYRWSFITEDGPPPSAGGFTATGQYKGAALRWSNPDVADFDRVIVRMTTGGTAPGSPTSGSAVYSGTGTSKTVTGLNASTTYSFAIWAQDSAGAYSGRVTRKLTGTTLSATASSSTIYYGRSVKITGKLAKTYNGAAIPWQPVKIYSRRKGTTTWILHTTLTTNSVGAYSYTHKPTSTREYYVKFSGSTTYMGDHSPIRTVTVKR